MSSECVFCEIIESSERDLKYAADTFVAFRDKYPVTKGHTLVVPRSHWTTLEEVTPEAGQQLIKALRSVRSELVDRYDPDGFNVGLNEGADAGQTIEHMHWHVIPRRRGDVPDPEGGVRGVIPENQSYR